MKTWHCEYQWYGSYGAYQTADCICFANSKEEAIQFAENYYNSMYDDGHKCNAQDWTATELTSESGQVHHISSRSS